MEILSVPATLVAQSSSMTLPLPRQRSENSTWRRFEPAALTEALGTVSAVNEQLLEALVESARSDSAEFPLSGSLRPRVAGLSFEECRWAARCGVLLADANLADSRGWRDVQGHDKGNIPAVSRRPWLPMEQSISLAHSTLLVSWYLIHSTPAVARVLLGLSAAGVAACRELGVGDLAKLARRHPECVRPRWPDRLDVWTHLLEGAICPGIQESRSMTLHCLQVSARDSGWRSTCSGSPE
jgi:hypothetical protein